MLLQGNPYGKPVVYLLNSFAMSKVETKKSSVFHSNPEILGGTVVFKGTRVPMQNLIDYLEGGYTLDEFLKDFPTVSRAQAVRGLEEAKSLLLNAAA